MNERLETIEQKIDGIKEMTGELVGMVRGLGSQNLSDEFREQLEQTEEAMRLLLSVVKVVSGNSKEQAWYDSDDAAGLMKLAPFTVRQKCRKGAIRGKKIQGAGTKGEWRISHEEIERYNREGDLNPPEPPEL